MSRLTFNHVFISLLSISAICAFLVPVQHTNHLRGWLDVAFAPVAYPVRRVTQIVFNRGVPVRPGGARLASGDAQREMELLGEIDQLRAKVAKLTVQLAELRRVYRDRDMVGNAEEYGIPVKVIGGDSSSRDALLLAGTSADGLQVGMCVLYHDFVVGKITAVGGGGAQVRLITDSGFRANGLFARFNGTTYTPIETDTPQVEGIGRGLMTITNLPLSKVKDIREDDVVQLWDPEDWPTIVHGSFLGRVARIEPLSKFPGFAQITVSPWRDLHRLNEVMVLTLKPKTPAAPAVVTHVVPAAVTHSANVGMNKNGSMNKPEKRGRK